MGVGKRLLCISYAWINSVTSILPMKGIETSICSIDMMTMYSRQMSSHTFKNAIKGLLPLHMCSKHIHHKWPIICNLHCAHTSQGSWQPTSGSPNCPWQEGCQIPCCLLPHGTDGTWLQGRDEHRMSENLTMWTTGAEWHPVYRSSPPGYTLTFSAKDLPIDQPLCQEVIPWNSQSSALYLQMADHLACLSQATSF